MCAIISRARLVSFTAKRKRRRRKQIHQYTDRFSIHRTEKWNSVFFRSRVCVYLYVKITHKLCESTNRMVYTHAHTDWKTLFIHVTPSEAFGTLWVETIAFKTREENKCMCCDVIWCVRGEAGPGQLLESYSWFLNQLNIGHRLYTHIQSKTSTHAHSFTRNSRISMNKK